jgi:hypothetical protein
VAKEVAGDEGLFPFERVHLQRLLLAADVILELSGEGPVSDVLEAELRDFRERVQLALLRLRFLPGCPQVGSEVAHGGQRAGATRCTSARIWQLPGPEQGADRAGGRGQRGGAAQQVDLACLPGAQ